jgi:hypothetical protein
VAPGEVSGVLARAALAHIAADPLTFLHRMGLRVAALLESFETGIVAIPEVEAGTIPPLRAAALPFGVLVALAGAGWVLARGRREALPSPAPLLPSLALAGMVVLTALVFFHYSRFRLPLVPLLAVLGARGFDAARLGAPGLLRGASALLLAAALAAASWWPAPHHEHTRALGLVSLAEARLAQAPPGDVAAVQAALDEADAALAHDPGLGRALLTAANASFTLGRFDDCARHLARLLEGLPDHGPALVTAAWLAASPRTGNGHFDPVRAAALLERLRLLAASDETVARALPALERQVEAAQARAGG